ncbi:ATP-binding protein [Actinomycetospora sp. TBRC 11914]|uniref:ATP-binding protein n=1 Tax=Actinomycetospora sp. TBRC 11914 TaxID=2729387 RepID=UPI00145EA775|nr:ATP-binding protein [Actinomycetospora sp. TBRC 11914]NMO92559.1 ATP-binding protein [Actinomycetospora sp. TBRC 11914]
MSPHAALDLVAEAAPPRVGAFRRSLRRWLGDALEARQTATGEAPDLDDELEDLADDLVLATSEALENVVDHAFADATNPGTMTLRADLVDDVVTIVVADDGRWREPTTGPTSRGRGLTLMESLTEVEVDHGRTGTTVTMRRPLPVNDRRSAQA